MSMLAESAKRNGRPEAAVNWWRRRDSRFRLFRGGLDYAFILLPGCGACYPLVRILVRARRLPLGSSMSLYGAGMRLALFLPLGVAMPSALLRAVRRQGSPM